MGTFFVFIGAVVGTLVLLAALAAAFYYLHQDEIERQQANVVAAMRAWQVQQAEAAAEAEIRRTTRRAVEEMLDQSRRREAMKRHPSSGQTSS
jgi:type II secretory pathway component PulK